MYISPTATKDSINAKMVPPPVAAPGHVFAVHWRILRS